jgi:hypothetical protein
MTKQMKSHDQMKTTMQKTLPFVAASSLAMTANFSTDAQTYTWNQQAVGQGITTGQPICGLGFAIDSGC